MSRLPPAVQPLWPVVKRLHRLLSLVNGILMRPVSRLWGSRSLPGRAIERSVDTVAHEPSTVVIHPGNVPDLIRRRPPVGDPPGHWSFLDAAEVDLPRQFTLDIAGGVVVGDYGAVITPGGVLDYETSPYFDIASWREHPIFLRRRLPPIEEVADELLVLATRGGSGNYYHFLLDVLPRYATFERCLPGETPTALYVPAQLRHEKELLTLTGLDRQQIVATGKHRAVRADRLLVPSLPNPLEVAPTWVVEWLRSRLPARERPQLPTRLYVTRGNGPRTRRLVSETAVWPELESRGFVRIDPGAMSVQDQIDHFAAAEVIVGIHGAALTNLVFARPGVKVLHLFAPQYVKHCFWAILDSIPGAEYRYLVGEGTPAVTGRHMNGIQDDIMLDPARILGVVDRLLAEAPRRGV